MLPADKDLMRMHLDTIYYEICRLDDGKDDSFTGRLNLDLINIRERIRQHIKKLESNMEE